MFAYQAFGLSIRSELELPELTAAPAGEGACDLEIRLKPLGLIAGAAASFHHFSEARQTFVYPGVGAYVIAGENDIAIEPAPGSNPLMLALPLLGPVMGLLLHLKGRFVLHGSAVRFGKRSFGFLGDKGAGKSTLAAALLQHGEVSLLSDDLVAFDDRAEIFPAFPQLKLSSEALILSKDVGAKLMPAPAPNFPKHQVRLARELGEARVPTRALYELRRAERMHIEPLTRAEALKTLIQFAYVVRFAARKMLPGEHKHFFAQAAGIANRIEIARLYVPHTIDRLPDVAELLASVEDGPQSRKA
ncbi:MAG: hypothetical protein QM773_01310 [Hyphomonadaceae bacterium]